MSEVSIRFRKNGPLIVTGDVTLTDHEGNALDTSGRENIALCRCGATNKLPFCDGTHRHVGWQDSDSTTTNGIDQ